SSTATSCPARAPSDPCTAATRPPTRPVPELPDVTVYLEALAPRILGERLERLRLASPFFLRSVEPPIAAVEGRRVVGLRRLGKRLVVAMEDDLFLVLH